MCCYVRDRVPTTEVGIVNVDIGVVVKSASVDLGEGRYTGIT